jgi:hypothetical protein
MALPLRPADYAEPSFEKLSFLAYRQPVDRNAESTQFSKTVENRLLSWFFTSPRKVKPKEVAGGAAQAPTFAFRRPMATHTD